MKKDTTLINLKKIVHRVYCDDCNVELESTGEAYMTAPPQYSYYCPNCNRRYTFWESYPWAEIVGDEVDEYGMAVSL